MLGKIKNILKSLSITPLHPQWLCRGASKHLIRTLKRIDANGVVLDIGCFNKWPKDVIPKSCTYIGLDYLETAQNWYHSRPDIYGDACRLPIQSGCIDIVLLLDVLEHLQCTTAALKEIHRCLTGRGMLIIQAPFMYPLHDEPRDFLRLTKYGFEHLANECGFDVEAIHSVGHPIETSVLLFDIALAKVAINWIKSKSPASLFIILLPLWIIINNLLARVLVWICQEDSMMPYSYEIILSKK